MVYGRYGVKPPIPYRGFLIYETSSGNFSIRDSEERFLGRASTMEDAVRKIDKHLSGESSFDSVLHYDYGYSGLGISRGTGKIPSLVEGLDIGEVSARRMERYRLPRGSSKSEYREEPRETPRHTESDPPKRTWKRQVDPMDTIGVKRESSTPEFKNKVIRKYHDEMEKADSAANSPGATDEDRLRKEELVKAWDKIKKEWDTEKSLEIPGRVWSEKPPRSVFEILEIKQEQDSEDFRRRAKEKYLEKARILEKAVNVSHPSESDVSDLRELERAWGILERQWYKWGKPRS